MASDNSKLSQMSVAMICVVMMQFAFVVSAFTERVSGPPHFDRFLGSVLGLSVPWVLVLMVDTAGFPTMKMTRLILGPARRVSVIAAGIGTVGLAFDMLGGSSRFSPLAFVAEILTAFIGMWGLVSLALLARERFRLSRDIDGSYREKITNVRVESR